MRDKQIEELTRIICRSNIGGKCGYDGQPCDCDCRSYQLATKVYNAGYRKASDVAREMIDEVKECFAQMTEEVENAMVEASQQENKTLYTTTKYGRDVLLLARHTLLKTLKKKYESEDN